MGIFDQYGIKEVADVTLYSIHKKSDGSGDVYYVPALYFDTLKVSSVDKTGENVWARGGLNNSKLICWDYGQDITVNLEDALCTPASLGLCWGGILSSDWKDGKIEHKYGISVNNDVKRLTRMEKVHYPRSDRDKNIIAYLLPQTKEDLAAARAASEFKHSTIVEEADINGFGTINGHCYSWTLNVNTSNKSVITVLNKCFDINGNSILISDSGVGIKTPEDSDDFKLQAIYPINGGSLEGITVNSPSVFKETEETVEKEYTLKDIATANFLKIVVDQENEYTAYLGDTLDTISTIPTNLINTEQFKGIDMWTQFTYMNELIYYLITKYEDNICSLGVDEAAPNKTPSLWAYINPKTMSPLPDDYWFQRGEVYYLKSLTFARENKGLKAKRIEVKAGQFPGMYMLVGETYIRSRDTGEDERMQIKLPLGKVLTNQGITLEAEGDPTVFSLSFEIANPKNGIMMELTSYEVAEKMIPNENGVIELSDGSTEVISE